jgi:hypothetical protein
MKLKVPILQEKKGSGKKSKKRISESSHQIDQKKKILLQKYRQFIFTFLEPKSTVYQEQTKPPVICICLEVVEELW